MKNATDITIILDRSGSMDTIRTDTIGGYNNFLTDQKAVPGECRLTLVQFDTMNPYEVVYAGVPIAEAQALTLDTYKPRAGTPLLDAIGRGITETGQRLSAMPEADRPNKVVLVIITDGYENSSREYKLPTVKDMVEHQRSAYKWEFVFLGANMDAIAVGGNMGFAAYGTMSVAADAAGTRAMYDAVSTGVMAFRTDKSTRMEFSDKDRDAQKRDKNKKDTKA